MSLLPIKLIVGLGNPGSQYVATRHNAGFWFIDSVANMFQVKMSLESKFFGYIGKFNYQGQDIFIFKPETFMNLSGKAVLAVANFYKITPNQILAVHDELDFMPGTVKLKFAGGNGGHNGLRDIERVLGRDYWRLRLGIGHPGDKNMVHDYVLKKPNIGDKNAIEESIGRGKDILPLILVGNFSQALKILHT